MGNKRHKGGGGGKEKKATITMGDSRRIKLHERVGERIDDDSSKESRVKSQAESQELSVVFKVEI